MILDFIIEKAFWILWGIAITTFICVENIQSRHIKEQDRLEKHMVLGSVAGLIGGEVLCWMGWKNGYSVGFLIALGPFAGLAITAALDNWL